MKRAFIFLICILNIIFFLACAKKTDNNKTVQLSSATLPTIDLNETVELKNITFKVSSEWAKDTSDKYTKYSDNFHFWPFGSENTQDNLFLEARKKSVFDDSRSEDEYIENRYNSFSLNDPSGEKIDCNLNIIQINGIKILSVEYTFGIEYHKWYCFTTKDNKYDYEFRITALEATYPTMCTILDSIMQTIQLKPEEPETSALSKDSPTPKEVFDYFGEMSIEWLYDNLTDDEAWEKIANHFNITVKEAKNLYKQYENKLYNKNN